MFAKSHHGLQCFFGRFDHQLMACIDIGYLAIVCQLNQRLGCFGLCHLVFLTEQKERGALDFGHVDFTLIVLIASLKTNVENILIGIAGQDPSHEGFAAA